MRKQRFRFKPKKTFKSLTFRRQKRKQMQKAIKMRKIRFITAEIHEQRKSLWQI